MVDCPDSSDEADCGELEIPKTAAIQIWTTDLRTRLSVFLKVNGSSRLQFQVGSTLLTACADTWNSRVSVSTCQYLGYR